MAESEEADKSPVSGKDEKAIPHISFIRVKYALILGGEELSFDGVLYTYTDWLSGGWGLLWRMWQFPGYLATDHALLLGRSIWMG